MDYTTWIESVLLEYEPVHLCEDIMDTENGKEWCEKNCHYSEPQRQCLRKAYEIRGEQDENME